MEPAFEGLGRSRPEVAPQPDRLVDERAPDGEALGHREIGELALAPADADPRDRPPARQRVERRDLLGKDNGVPLGHDDHRRPELDRRVPRPDPRERLENVEVRPVVRRVLARVDEDVVGRPDRVPAEPLGGAAAASIASGEARPVKFGRQSP